MNEKNSLEQKVKKCLKKIKVCMGLSAWKKKLSFNALIIDNWKHLNVLPILNKKYLETRSK